MNIYDLGNDEIQGHSKAETLLLEYLPETSLQLNRKISNEDFYVQWPKANEADS